MTDRLPAALWLAGRFIYDARRPDFLDVRCPDEVLASARREIDEEISAMLRGHPGHRVTSLAVGAVTIRQVAPTEKSWVAATAPLRSPCCQRQYLRAFEVVGEHISDIRRLARSLAGAGKLTAAECLWITDKPRQAA